MGAKTNHNFDLENFFKKLNLLLKKEDLDGLSKNQRGAVFKKIIYGILDEEMKKFLQ